MTSVTSRPELIELIFEAAGPRGSSRHPECLPSVKELAEAHSINVVNLRNSKNQTLLHIAAGYGRTSLVSYLLKNGADVNARDNEGQAPLHNACGHGHSSVSQVLIKYGANVNLADNRGWSPMHFAVSRGDNHERISPIYWQVIELLLEEGADPYLESNSGKNCMMKVKRIEDATDIKTKHLLTLVKGLDDKQDIFNVVNKHIQLDHIFALLNTSNEVDMSILDLVSTPKTVRFHLAMHHNVTPLHSAAGYNHIEAAKLLIQRGANVQAIDDRNRLPLHNAAQYGHVDMIELLVSAGSDVNKQDEGGNTPLHLAAPLKTFTACLKLMELGANVDLKNNSDQMAYDLAETGDVREVLRPHQGRQMISVTSGQAIYVDIIADEHQTHETDEKPIDHDLMLDSTSNCRLFNSTKYSIKIVKLTSEDQMFIRVKNRMLSTIQIHSSDSGGLFSNYEILGIDLILHEKVWFRYRLACQKLAAEYGSSSSAVKLARDRSVNERLLFHGSNFIESIQNYGFDERYAQRNGMFGAGVYFADHSSKSNQYVFGWGQGCQEHRDKSCYICERKLIYAQVALGRSLVSKEAMPDCAHAPPGYSSVTGSPESTENLVYPEYVIYNGDQAYPLFVIRYRICP